MHANFMHSFRNNEILRILHTNSTVIVTLDTLIQYCLITKPIIRTQKTKYCRLTTKHGKKHKPYGYWYNILSFTFKLRDFLF